MKGYYRYPALFGDMVAFVSEDGLWVVPASGGVARRLTTGLGVVSRPVFSPDGKWIAFAGSDEGPTEVYKIPSEGGPVQRLTWFGDTVAVTAWRGDGIYFTSPAAQSQRLNVLWRVDASGGVPQEMPLGPVNFAHFPEDDSMKCVIQRLGYREYGYWKRYRGGTAGDLWIDREGNGQHVRLISLESDLSRPLWLGKRIYFGSDHEGIGNIYSCTPEGQDLRRHTDHEDFYVRNQATDGKRIVYHAGGDLYLLDPVGDTSHKIEVLYQSPRMHRNRKFINAEKHLQSLALHPRGHYLTTVHRGKVFAFGVHEGPVIQCGVEGSHRYRLSRWLYDGKRIVMISDYDGHESLVVVEAETGTEITCLSGLDIGRVIELRPNPCGDSVALINHRSELIHVNLETRELKVVDKSIHHQFDGFNWSPDGKWIAYGTGVNAHQMIIRLADISTGAIHDVTRPVLRDGQPVFDPEGKYLFFLSCRDFVPTLDTMHFNYAFAAGMRPFLVTLQKGLVSPFLPQPKPLECTSDDENEGEGDDKKGEDKGEGSGKDNPDIQIDLEGIQDRILAFPVESGQFSHLCAVKGKILYLTWPLVCTDDMAEDDGNDEGEGSLEVFDLETLKSDNLAHGINYLEIAREGQFMALMSGKKLRIVKAGEKPEDSSDPKKSGWIDLSRVRPSVALAGEWEQIFREAWRLQKEQFWVADMSQVDWDRVYERYSPLVDRVSTRRELSDLIWEMQGELGTSHAYAWGGDLPYPPFWTVGQLGIDYEVCPENKNFRVKRILAGDSWDPRASSPLCRPGINLAPGSEIRSVNGRPVDISKPLEAVLVNQASQEVRLGVSDTPEGETRMVVVRTLACQGALRYRDWVNRNRELVHEKTGGRVGYLHIPDMSRYGYSEFHRGFLAECDRPGLIVDVRFNGGGNVSWLLLEKLARKRLGYDQSRWNGNLPYPMDSCSGRMVGLTNEYAGSDGDMFSHVFKSLKLGPLIGKRTWGGVIGIWPRHSLVDGGMTTQPEFSFWFEDVGWKLENYGVEPDIEVEITPADYAAGMDTQLERGISEILDILEGNPLREPVLTDRPDLSLPVRLPPRKK